MHPGTRTRRPMHIKQRKLKLQLKQSFPWLKPTLQQLAQQIIIQRTSERFQRLPQTHVCPLLPLVQSHGKQTHPPSAWLTPFSQSQTRLHA